VALDAGLTSRADKANATHTRTDWTEIHMAARLLKRVIILCKNCAVFVKCTVYVHVSRQISDIKVYKYDIHSYCQVLNASFYKVTKILALATGWLLSLD